MRPESTRCGTSAASQGASCTNEKAQDRSGEEGSGEEDGGGEERGEKPRTPSANACAMPK